MAQQQDLIVKELVSPTMESRDSRRRTVLKTVSWRLVASASTVLIVWIVTGDMTTGATVGGVEAVVKMVLYYGHERAWQVAGRRVADAR